jgi:hypothetical protein
MHRIMHTYYKSTSNSTSNDCSDPATDNDMQFTLIDRRVVVTESQFMDSKVDMFKLGTDAKKAPQLICIPKTHNYRQMMTDTFDVNM